MRLLAWLLVALGAGIVVGGISLVSYPAAAIVGGLAAVAVGLLAVDVDTKEKR